MRTFFILIISCLLVQAPLNHASAQLFDSIATAFDYKPKPLLKLEARNAFVTSSYVKMKGIKLGANFHNKLRLGIGYSWMKSDYLVEHFNDTSELKFGYGLAFFEYAFFNSDHWNLEIPIQIGLGRLAYKEDNTIKSRQWVPVWEPAMTMEYLFLKYFGIGFGAGYRLVIKSHTPITEQFTSPIYIFKFKINFGDIYKDVKRQLD
ncbi:hypothetical protein [Parvicella tangerina]|uniref:Outer membrane protein beta-barrel domain-containing protein n=1 Tax=Parvicella tangerina TaxID=2829795 RepID=A0A916JPV7_9FLAO|nr:hypothetical protein [Parvicella tangerina]CAG5086381.1 hypothetical protein CRYO30217_03102 [Parvicella tangerina]